LLKDHHFIKRIITCNEKWIYLNNPNLQKQWLDKGQLPVPVAKNEHFEKKTLLCVWRNYEGLISYELVPDGRVLLQQGNARPHTVNKTLQKIVELEGIELLPHPAFSLGLEQTEYCMFHCMAQFLRCKKFQSVVDVEFAVEEFFASKDKEWFYQAFKELAEKWVKTIEHEGLYFWPIEFSF
jgi:histone-lysine N-methyltransferase SETMAR